MKKMKKHKRNWKVLSLISLLIASVLTGCGTGSKQASAGAGGEDKVLQYQGSPGNASFPELAYDLGYLGDLTLDNVSNATGGPESIQLTATGDTDFGSAFNGAIVKAVSKNV